jgi:hypothetical protein
MDKTVMNKLLETYYGESIPFTPGSDREGIGFKNPQEQAAVAAASTTWMSHELQAQEATAAGQVYVMYPAPMAGKQRQERRAKTKAGKIKDRP